MSEPFIAQIQMWGCNYAPRGWAYCDGQVLAITENPELYSLIGITYGGDGRNTMGLPNLQARVPMHTGLGPGLHDHRLGEMAGSETIMLTEATMPAHTHNLYAQNANAEETQTEGNYLAKGGTPARGGRFIPINTYHPPKSMQPLASSALTDAGLSQGHENRQPFLVVNFCIALTGIYPNRP